jgi:GTP-binding protein
MFIDETEITVAAGDGGNGCFSHLREKYKPKGRPSGGNGGRGGHILVEGSSHLHTLQDMSYRKTYRAERGDHGKGSDKYGKEGEDCVIHLPLGTMIFDADTGGLLLDCLEHGARSIIAKGGRGGRGNAALATSRNRNPQWAEEGKPGERKRLRLVLKVLADIGLVGRPNAGKSTFLSAISRARPKIAEYPFTTTRPHLGIVRVPGAHESFVVADIPGLIEGSHEGKGLGTRFLRHIERTRILAIMVEPSGENPEAVARSLVGELSHYSEALAHKPAMFILTKSDLLGPALHDTAPPSWVRMSAVTGEGVDRAVREMKKILDENRAEE